MIGVLRTWGSTPEERRLDYACDRFLRDPQDTCYRAIDVRATRHVVFRWLCQLKAAPYSYDWIDNRGRTSPRFLVPDVDLLAVGQRAMTIFQLVDFEPRNQLTFTTGDRGADGPNVAVTYAVLPGPGGGSRIVVKLLMRYPGPLSTVRRWIPLTGVIMLAADLVMMRKQLVNLRDLAEGQMGELW
jgi:hypothetical protein